MSKKKSGSKVIYVLGDVHLPWCDWTALEEIADEIKLSKKRGDDVVVVQVGDLLDARAWSKYPKGPSDENAQLEWDQTESAMHRLYKLIPEMHILFGNHDERFAKKAMESLLPRQLIKSLDQYFNFSGWVWHTADEPLEINNIAFIHGDNFPIPVPATAALRLGQSVCYGHTHTAQIQYVVTFKKRIFAMNVGWLGDDSKSAFNYARKSPNRSFKGYGIIIDGTPHLVPL